MVDPPEDADFEEVARSFAALWHALTVAGGNAHGPERRRFLIDQVRNALDRGEDRLAGHDTTIIANTFLLEALVHEGATTRVHRARHRDLESLHAIKTLRPEQADDPVARTLLLREARIGGVIRHPNVAATQTLLRLADGRPALVLEWIDRSLADLVREAPLSVGGITQIIAAVLSGLDAIHAAGYVHGDLSLSNLRYPGDDLSRLKIGDFGIALETGRRHRDLDIAFAGRPQFAPPEQVAGQALDGRSDLHAAGLILSTLLDHCQETGAIVERLRRLATELARPQPQERPENAKAALHLLGGLDQEIPG
ncbi:type VI secretion system protein ImpN [Neorhizobium galegae]|uniref:serine/threonine-protein kinase n=1 Tax=Neorhizobium galegae TaxID=399 RepID=UPI00278744C4|nr:serine/threonine-protein kinase [Neorhizobium galegae]MDQ0134387.1 type VI secretion system protein ImpN [Neorhizobium galegae]